MYWPTVTNIVSVAYFFRGRRRWREFVRITLIGCHGITVVGGSASFHSIQNLMEDGIRHCHWLIINEHDIKGFHVRCQPLLDLQYINVHIYLPSVYEKSQPHFPTLLLITHNHESQNTDAQGTRAPTTTLYVLCGLQDGVRLYLPW